MKFTITATSRHIERKSRERKSGNLVFGGTVGTLFSIFHFVFVFIFSFLSLVCWFRFAKFCFFFSVVFCVVYFIVNIFIAGGGSAATAATAATAGVAAGTAATECAPLTNATIVEKLCTYFSSISNSYYYCFVADGGVVWCACHSYQNEASTARARTHSVRCVVCGAVELWRVHFLSST